MCKIWASKAQFLGHFGSQSKKNFWCLVTFSKRLHWFHKSIASHAHSKYFQMCGEYGPQWPNFWVILGPQIDHNSGNFIKHFPMVSHHSRFTCLLGVLLCAFQLCAPKALFLGLELRLHRSLLCHQASCIERVTYYIITSSNENVFCVTVPMWEESTRQRWIPFTKGR